MRSTPSTTPRSQQGGSDDGAPGFRDRGTGPHCYYAAFIRDRDGNCIEAVTFPSAA